MKHDHKDNIPTFTTDDIYLPNLTIKVPSHISAKTQSWKDSVSPYHSYERNDSPVLSQIFM